MPENPFRKAAIAICTSKVFEYFIILMIILCSIKLVMDTYVAADSEFYTILSILDKVFNSIFIFECCLKIVAQGLVLGEKAYLKSTWSKLDFFIVMIAVL